MGCFKEHPGIRWYWISYPHITSDHRTRSDNCFFTKNSCFRINNYIIFNRWMTFLSPQLRSSILGQRQRSQGDSLIKPDVFSNLRRFPNNNSGPMVNKKALSDLSARMNVNTRDTVSVFSHDTRNEGYFLFIKFMSNAINHNRKDARITKNNLIKALSGGVTFMS